MPITCINFLKLRRDSQDALNGYFRLYFFIKRRFKNLSSQKIRTC